MTWNNGDAFTAADVAFNITRWCDGNVEGNSMAGRMASLVNPDTKMARDGAITVVDDHTVKLTFCRRPTSRSSSAWQTIRRPSCTRPMMAVIRQ